MMTEMWHWKNGRGIECVANEVYCLVEDLWRDGMFLYRQDGTINLESIFWDWFKSYRDIYELFDLLYTEAYATNNASKVLDVYFEDFRGYIETESVYEEGTGIIIEGYYPNGMDLYIPWEEVGD